MNILFINFNIGATPGINNGLTVLSSVLKAKGHLVKALFLSEELGYPFDLVRMKRDVEDFKPDLIGASIMEPQYKYMADFCKNLKSYYDGFMIAGGPHPTMDPEAVLQTEGVDAVCVGEGEDAILELISALETGRDHTKIRNIWCKAADGRPIKNALRPFKDLNALPPEDKELFDLDAIIRLKNYQLEMMLGRGCAYRCAYCINQSYVERYTSLCDSPVHVNDYIRVKSADTVLKELKDTVSRHAEIKKIAFIDDNFLMYKTFNDIFCQRYRDEVRLPFMCNVNPISFSLEKGRVLKAAGCDDIRFGVESGSERVKRDIMMRPISNKSVVDAFKATKELGLMTSSFNMIGLPTETREEVFDTLKLNALIMPDSLKVMTFYPFKNTPLYDKCVSLNLIDETRKKQLDNYDTFTCLKFSDEYRLFLKKVQTAFNWYMNVFLDNGSSAEYAALVKEMEGMNESEWDSYDFYGADKEISARMRKKGITHYSKFMNRSLAVKFPSKHLR